MEFENLVKLIHTVSQSGINHFTYEEGGVKIAIENSTNSVRPVEKTGEAAAPSLSPGQRTMKSPLVGTFYKSPSPSEPPFVQIGDTVSNGQVIGIVEAMKLMNEIESEFDGKIKEILVSDGDVVEFGQPMFVIE